MKNPTGIRACAAAAVICALSLASPARATIVVPEEIWGALIPPTTFFDELIAGNFRAAFRLAKDAAIRELRDQLLNGKGVPKIGAQLARALNKIIDDPTKTDIQKEDEIFLLINASLEPQATAPVGELGLTLRHSIEFGVTRLEWNQMTAYDVCDGGFASTSCTDSGPNGGFVCNYTGGGTRDYVRREPAYAITRIVNGVAKPVTVLGGALEVHSNTWSFGPSLRSLAMAGLKAWYATHYNVPFSDIQPGRVIFYDFHGDFVEPGQTLQYKVESSDALHRLGQCGKVHNYQATAVADSNGDGRMDYIPVAAYGRFFGKYYGWLPSVLGVVAE